MTPFYNYNIWHYSSTPEIVQGEIYVLLFFWQNQIKHGKSNKTVYIAVVFRTPFTAFIFCPDVWPFLSCQRCFKVQYKF